ncbi:hypothetical protein BVX98_01355 [bacterium F11]|nr:hypothetical protein BVX98_01355 [bacterium F11]
MKKFMATVCLAALMGICYVGVSQAGCHTSCVNHDMSCDNGYDCGNASCNVGQDGSTCNFMYLSTVKEFRDSQQGVLAMLGGAMDTFVTPAYATHTGSGPNYGVRNNENKSASGRGNSSLAKADACIRGGHGDTGDDLQTCASACDGADNIACAMQSCVDLCCDAYGGC